MLSRILSQFLLLAFGCTCAVHRVTAQVPEPPSAPIESQTQEAMERTSDIRKQKLTVSFDERIDAPLRYGPVVLRPGAAYSVAYNDNIFGGRTLPSGADKQDVIHRIQPDLSFSVIDQTGDAFLVPSGSYSPEFVFLHNNSDRNTINHSGRIQFTKVLPKTTFVLNHNSSSIQDIYAEAATLERQGMHLTRFEVEYELGGKTTIESFTTQTLQQRAEFAVKEWRQEFWFNYLWLPKVDLAGGIGGGWAMVDPGQDSFLQSDQVRLRYYPTAKLTFELRAGVEARFFQGTDGKTAIGPIAGFTANYDVRRQTTLSFQAERRTVPSIYLADQLTEYTSVGLNVRRNFGRRYFVDVSGSYNFAEFESTTQSAAEVGSYDYYQAKVQLGVLVTRRAAAAIFYRRLSRSAGGGYDQFAANEFGLNVGYHF